jgi:hypothetical protein
VNNDEILKAELAKALAECKRLREENARLRLRIGEDLEADHQDVERPSLNDDVKAHPSAAVTVDSPPEVIVSLFKDLFRARNDVYAVRWEGRNGKTGYSPAGDKEWDNATSFGPGPKKSFRLTKLFSLTEEVIRDHLLGKQTIGVYPLLQDDTCWFVVVDFDKKSWKEDACAYLKICHETAVPASLERSRSGKRRSCLDILLQSDTSRVGPKARERYLDANDGAALCIGTRLL